MRPSFIYRADLMLALQEAGDTDSDRDFLAELCGFAVTHAEPKAVERLPSDEVTPVAPIAKPEVTPPEEKFPFWRASSFSVQDAAEYEEERMVANEVLTMKPATEEEISHAPDYQLPGADLMRWPRLWPFLQRVLSGERRGSSPDIPRLVKMLAQGKAMRKLPAMPRRKWSRTLHLVVDRRDDLAIFWGDFEQLVKRVDRMRGSAGFQLHDADIVLKRPDLLTGEDSAVLVLGDLAQYSDEGERSRWLMLGRDLRRAGVNAWVLCPCPRQRWRADLARVWDIAEWDRGSRLPQGGLGSMPAEGHFSTEAAKYLRILLSFPTRIEPGLLRDLRVRSHPEADVGLEWENYMRSDCTGWTTFSYPPEDVKLDRLLLAQLPDGLIADLVKCLVFHHQATPVFLCREITALLSHLPLERKEVLIHSGCLTGFQQTEAVRQERALLAAVSKGKGGFGTSGMKRFVGRDVERNADAILSMEEDKQIAWWLAHGEEGKELPPFINPAVIAPFIGRNETGSYEPVILLGNGLQAGGEVGRQAYPLVRFRRKEGCIALDFGNSKKVDTWGTQLLDHTALRSHSQISLQSSGEIVGVERFTRPAWAHRMWYDRYGLAAEFRVEDVPFVLRWIPPGRFLMGSPEEEPGRRDAEGPQHERVITEGFWLGETVVTQAQWRAVMGQNPSYFKGPTDLPVEQVSWEDCGDFCRKLKALVPGLDWRLPEEAEWEYAGRAGTDTALWTGGITIRESYDPPELEEIAWYVGNSWQEPQVENLYDMKNFDWRHPKGAKAGTHAVKGKEANPWGLYDLLGNVWEWCGDAWDEAAYAKFERGEPAMEGGDGAQRVVRGGSWFGPAGDCRAAFRFGFVPGLRWIGLGFRLAAGQEPGAAEPPGSGATLPERRSRARRAVGSSPA